MRTRRRTRSHRALIAWLVIPSSLGVWLAMNGCGDQSFTATSADAASDGTSPDGASDAATDAVVIVPFDGGACNLTKAFGPLMPITELNTVTAQEQTARLTHDELNIYFQQQVGVSFSGDAGDSGSGDAGFATAIPFQLMTASRSNNAAMWSTPVPVAGVGSPSISETDPSVSPDNDILYFASDQSGTKGASDLWVATRGTPGMNFGSVTNVTALNTAADESEPYLMPAGLALYYRSKASGNFDLAHATRTTSSGFVPDLDSGIFQMINTSNIEGLATVTFDELTLYFTTDRSDPGKGGREIWKATRATLNDPFGTPTPVGELNTSSFDEPSWISDDGCRIYVTSTSAGTADLYVASKPVN